VIKPDAAIGLVREQKDAPPNPLGCAVENLSETRRCLQQTIADGPDGNGSPSNKPIHLANESLVKSEQ